jgi:ribA/ribD-fused uncharacterized protein
VSDQIVDGGARGTFVRFGRRSRLRACAVCQRVAPRPGHDLVVTRFPSAAERLDWLLSAELDGSLPEFLFFWGHTATADHPGPWVLSQWWPVEFRVDDVTYRHAEGYMMAEKARLFGDEVTRRKIVQAAHPGEAKNLGRGVRHFDQARWDQERYEIVVRGNLAKFGQHSDLAIYLRSTAPRILVEASPRDRVWGIGLGRDQKEALRPSEWQGLNLLGFALVEVRDRLEAGER